MLKTALLPILLCLLLILNSVSTQPWSCTGPTPFCEGIVADAKTIEEAWVTYGASNAALTNTVLSTTITTLTAQQDIEFQECMINIHHQFNGESVSSTNEICRKALGKSTETEAIDFYRNEFFYRIVLELVQGIVSTMITLSDNGGDCNLAKCSYLITESFPKVMVKEKLDKEKKEETNLNSLLQMFKILDEEKRNFGGNFRG